ncbi:MAG TPA: ATP synthase subunit I [Acidimicrobiales bacterium]|nr:ATP synthase subunit I [Acidimicrobiales bacterium]
MSAAVTTRDDGPAVEREIVTDMVKRGLPAVPVLLILGAAGWGFDGVVSTAYAIAIVVANLILSSAILAWSARISLGLLMGAALFGYLIRLGLIALAVLAVKDMGWVELWPLGLALIVTHLGLLLWEMRYVSASLAFPGLKPRKD